MTKSGISLSVLALLSLGACSGMRGNQSERQEDNMAKSRNIERQEAETARDFDTESGYFEDDMEMQEEGMNSESDYLEDDGAIENDGRDTGVEHPAQGDDYEQREEDNKARKAKHEQLDEESLEEE
jgi:hypothetical protein